MNWISVVSLIGAAQGCFIAYLVLAHGRQKRANLWLGLYVLAYAALCLGDALSHSSLVPRYPDLSALFDFCVFLLGPFLYQYVRILTRRKPLGAVLWLHLIPSGLVLALQILFHLLPAGAKHTALANEPETQGQVDVFTVAAAIQILAYLAAALLLLREYAQVLKQSYSSLEKRSFVWLRNLLLVNGGLWVVWAIRVATNNGTATALDYLGFPVAGYILAAFALRAPEIFSSPEDGGAAPSIVEAEPATPAPQATVPQEEREETRAETTELPSLPESVDSAAPGKYQKSRLPEAILSRYQAKLEKLMSEKKVYLDDDLTLPQLAERLAVPQHHLSQLLNERLGVNFFDYVNRQRVNEIKQLLRDPNRADQSILDLAFEAGFRSKSSFNSIFKRATGYSPSVYRKLSPSFSISQEVQTSGPMGRDDTSNTSA